MSDIDDIQKFHDAVLHADKRRVKKILLTKEFQIDVLGESERTALYLACEYGCDVIVNTLLRYGANPNCKSIYGSTPVHAAAKFGSVKIMSMLLSAGGDVRFHDDNNYSIHDWVQNCPDEKKRKKLSEFLEKIKLFAMSFSYNELEGRITSAAFLQRWKKERAPYWSSVKGFNGSSSKIPFLCSYGYDTMCFGFGGDIGIMGSVPVVSEGELKHDGYGNTYNNGPFVVMESMKWKTTEVTVKRLHKSPPKGGNIDLLIKEKDHVLRLRHPNILLLMGVCQTVNMDGLVLVYERVKSSLFAFLYRKDESMNTLTLCEVLKQICEAVEFLHQRRFIHCNISSHAIQLVSKNYAKLSNFEYMVDSAGKTTTSDVVNNRSLHASYNWMAPEIMAGLPPCENSDLYSIASVMWELINGMPPWSGLQAEDIELELLANGNSVPISETMGNPFNCLLKFGLAGDPEKRGVSISQFQNALDNYLLEENGSSELDSLLKSLKGTVDLSASNTGTATVLSTERTQESTLEQFTSISMSGEEYTVSDISEELPSGNTDSAVKNIPVENEFNHQSKDNLIIDEMIHCENDLLSKNPETFKEKDFQPTQISDKKETAVHNEGERTELEDEIKIPEVELFNRNTGTSWKNNEEGGNANLESLRIGNSAKPEEFENQRFESECRLTTSPEEHTDASTSRTQFSKSAHSSKSKFSILNFLSSGWSTKKGSSASEKDSSARLSESSLKSSNGGDLSPSGKKKFRKRKSSTMKKKKARSYGGNEDCVDRANGDEQDLQKQEALGLQADIHPRPGLYRLDISGIDKLTETDSSLPPSDVECRQKIITKERKVFNQDPQSNDSETKQSSEDANPFKKFLSTKYDDIISDEIKAILAKPMVMPKLPSQYSSLRLYSRRSVEQKAPSMSDGLAKHYPRSSSKTTMVNVLSPRQADDAVIVNGRPTKQLHIDVQQKARTLPTNFEAYSSLTQITSPISAQNRSYSSLGSSYLSPSTQANDSVVKPASHHVPEKSPLTPETVEHYAFSKSPRHVTYPGCVTMSYKQLQQTKMQQAQKSSPVAAVNQSAAAVAALSYRQSYPAKHLIDTKSAYQELNAGASPGPKTSSPIHYVHHTSSVSDYVPPKDGRAPPPVVTLNTCTGSGMQTISLKSEDNVKEVRECPSPREKFFGTVDAKGLIWSEPYLNTRVEKTVRLTTSGPSPVLDRTPPQARNTTTAWQQHKNTSLRDNLIRARLSHKTGKGVRDIAEAFQEQLNEHVRKQASLIAKNNKSTSDGETFYTPKHLRQPTVPARRMVQTYLTLDSGMRASAAGNTNNNRISSTNIQLQKYVQLPGQKNSPAGDFPEVRNKSPGYNVKRLSTGSPPCSAKRAKKSTSMGSSTDEEVTSLIEEIVNGSFQEVLVEYVHPECPHQSPQKSGNRGIGTGESPQLSWNMNNNNAAASVGPPSSDRSSGSCNSGTAHTGQGRRAAERRSDDSSSSNKQSDIEEFYFDDVINPDLCNERYMRLESTMALDYAAAANNSSLNSDNSLNSVLESKKPLFSCPKSRRISPAYVPVYDLETPKAGSSQSIDRFKTSRRITKLSDGDEIHMAEDVVDV